MVSLLDAWTPIPTPPRKRALQDPRAGQGTDWVGRREMLRQLRTQRIGMGQGTPEDFAEIAVEEAQKRAVEAEARAQAAEARMAEMLEQQRLAMERQVRARDAVAEATRVSIQDNGFAYGKLLRSKREELSLRLEDVARMAGCDKSTVHRLELSGHSKFAEAIHAILFGPTDQQGDLNA